MEEEIPVAVSGRSPVFASWMDSVRDSKGISSRSLQQQALVENMADFVLGLAPWYVFATHTFRRPFSIEVAEKCYRRFMDASLPSISYFYAVEEHPGGHGGHVHAIWDSLEAPRKATHKEWLKRYGRNRIEPVQGRKDVVQYCAKVCYLLKQERCWWDYHLSRSRFSKVQKRQAGCDAWGVQLLPGRSELFPPNA